MDLINQYYDNKSAPATSMLEILHQLHDSEIGIELPNISASYDEVRKYRLARIQEK
jgi:uroporphyrin-3 C-methyltransferase